MPERRRTASVETPASFGVHGPGEMIRPAGAGGGDAEDVDAVVAHHLRLVARAPRT